MKKTILTSTLILFISISVFGQLYYKTISAGSEFSMAIRSDSTLFAWGFNGNGQLGINNTTTQHSPVIVDSNSKWIAVSAGAWHCLAIKADGSLWAWGLNTQGQLGDGTVVQRNQPTPLTTFDRFCFF
jgi:alpha-tubulin suppressor-like RCC1 family protein